MLIQDQHPLNKSIMASVLGAPNVGKSSLVNYLLGFDLSIVTARPQTTRNKFHCAFTVDHTEIILVDTPGVHSARAELNRRMNTQAFEGSSGADINLVLIDLSKNILDQVVNFTKLYQGELYKSWIVFTKSDLLEKEQKEEIVKNGGLEKIVEQMKEMIPSIEQYFVTSSTEGEGIHLLTGALCDSAQSGHHLYPHDAMSDKNERFFVTEYVREQLFLLLREELPYEVAVVIDEFKDYRDEKVTARSGKLIMAYISASILVNRASQRAIVIGNKGSGIRDIGTKAREKIEELIGGQVHLKLHVKVANKWFKNNIILEQLGLPRGQDAARIWRQKGE